MPNDNTSNSISSYCLVFLSFCLFLFQEGGVGGGVGGGGGGGGGGGVDLLVSATI